MKRWVVKTHYINKVSGVFLTQSPVYNVILKWNKCRDSGADKTEEMFQPVDDLIHLQLQFLKYGCGSAGTELNLAEVQVQLCTSVGTILNPR